MRARLLAVMQRPRFAVVATGEGVPMVGDAAFEIGVAWVVIQTTGSLTALAGVLLFRAFPRSVLLLLDGALVDGYSARRVLLSCHVVSAIVMVLATVMSANGEAVLCGGQGIVFSSRGHESGNEREAAAGQSKSGDPLT